MIEEVGPAGERWLEWRRDRLAGHAGPPPPLPEQDEEGGFRGYTGRPSPGATGEALCHLVVLGLRESGEAAVAADWLEEARTPAQAWLDSPDDVPGVLDDAAAGRVWATAAASCGLLAVGRDPGPRALALLRGEAGRDGRFTGGPYPTCAAAGAYWLAHGPKNEMAEWALKWVREAVDELDAWAKVSALTFWAAARIPAEHLSVDELLEALREEEAGDDSSPELELRVAEVTAWFDA